MRRWVSDGRRNTFQGIIEYHNAHCGYKLCADWRGTYHCKQEKARLQGLEEDDEEGHHLYSVTSYIYDNSKDMEEPFLTSKPAFDRQRDCPVVCNMSFRLVV